MLKKLKIKETLRKGADKLKGLLKTLNLRNFIDVLIGGFFNIFIPITYLAFICAGVFSALVSGLIEYQVFAELFPKDMQDTKYLIFSIPFLIVISFETTKVFLIFLDKAYSQSNNEVYINNKGYFNSLRIALVSVSVVATLLFSFYNLHNPEYGKVLSKATIDIERDFESQIERINISFDKQIKEQIKPLNEDIIRYNNMMKTEEGFKFKGRQEFRGPRYNEAKKLRSETEDKRQQIIITLNKERNKEISRLNTEKNIQIDNKKQELKTSSASGNKMLSATLQVINMKAEFPQVQYILIIGFLSILISFGLEYIIWAAFTVLAINHGNIFINKLMMRNDEEGEE